MGKTLTNTCALCGNRCDYRAFRCNECNSKKLPLPEDFVRPEKKKRKVKPSKSLFKKGRTPWNKGLGRKKLTREELSDLSLICIKEALNNVFTTMLNKISPITHQEMIQN